MIHPFDRSTADEVLEKTILHDRAMVAFGRALAPAINSMLDGMAERMLESVKSSMEDWCPGCGERTLLDPDLCSECLSVGND